MDNLKVEKISKIKKTYKSYAPTSKAVEQKSLLDSLSTALEPIDSEITEQMLDDIYSVNDYQAITKMNISTQKYIKFLNNFQKKFQHLERNSIGKKFIWDRITNIK